MDATEIVVRAAIYADAREPVMAWHRQIDDASAQSVAFAGMTGTLKLDDSLAFTGQVSGLSGSDALDLADVSLGANTTATLLATLRGEHSWSPTGRRRQTSP